MAAAHSGAKESLVVVRFMDGRILKGTTLDFFPNRDFFHVRPTDSPKDAEAQRIAVEDLKALFFVKTLEGDPSREEQLAPAAKGGSSEKTIVVKFKDGEVLAAGTLAYSPDRAGFFATPLDETSNNERVYIVESAIEAVRLVPPSENIQDVVNEMKGA